MIACEEPGELLLAPIKRSRNATPDLPRLLAYPLVYAHRDVMRISKEYTPNVLLSHMIRYFVTEGQELFGNPRPES